MPWNSRDFGSMPKIGHGSFEFTCRDFHWALQIVKSIFILFPGLIVLVFCKCIDGGYLILEGYFLKFFIKSNPMLCVLLKRLPHLLFCPPPFHLYSQVVKGSSSPEGLGLLKY